MASTNSAVRSPNWTINRLRSLRDCEACRSIALIVLVTVLAHALLIRQIGAYWDDWFYGWVAHAQGTEGLLNVLAYDRPVQGWVMVFNYTLLDHHTQWWQVYTLAIRLLSVLAFWWALRGLWPDRRLATTAMALVFAIYPGFLQQPILIYHYHFTVLTIFALSLGATIRAEQSGQRTRRLVLTVFAALSGLLYLLLLEHFIGLEALRLMIIWYIVVRFQPDTMPRRAQMMWIARHWLIYLAVSTVFLCWRFFIYDSPRDATDMSLLLQRFADEPGFMVMRLSVGLIRDSLSSVLLAWFAPANAQFSAATTVGFALALGPGMVGAGLLLWYYRWLKRRPEFNGDREFLVWRKDTLLIGIFGVLAALVPVLFSDRHVRLLDSYDRYTLPALAAISLLTVALLFILRPSLRPWVLALMVGLSITTHVLNAERYRAAWQLQRNLWWQLSWRAPLIEPDTALIVHVLDEAPADVVVINPYEIWGPANLIYYPEAKQPPLFGMRLNQSAFDTFEQGQAFDWSLRGVSFEVESADTLILSISRKSGCLHVLDGSRLGLPARADGDLWAVAAYSNISRIREGRHNVDMLTSLFGDEPSHSWCYYFQKAEFARQQGNWTEVMRLGEEARAQGLEPQDHSEWRPFFEAYVCRFIDHVENYPILSLSPEARHKLACVG